MKPTHIRDTWPRSFYSPHPFIQMRLRVSLGHTEVLILWVTAVSAWLVSCPAWHFGDLVFSLVSSGLQIPNLNYEPWKAQSSNQGSTPIMA